MSQSHCYKLFNNLGEDLGTILSFKKLFERSLNGCFTIRKSFSNAFNILFHSLTFHMFLHQHSG